jgi:ribosome maturation factor RimP
LLRFTVAVWGANFESVLGIMTKKTDWEAGPGSALESKLTELAAPVVAFAGLNLLELELRGDNADRILRVYVDRAEGVNLDDCERVSRQLGDMLDVEDLIPGRYRLEVSSPGLERKLKSKQEFDWFAGRRARLLVAEDGANTYYRGTLLGRQGDEIGLKVDDREMKFSLEHIIKARLEA